MESFLLPPIKQGRRFRISWKFSGRGVLAESPKRGGCRGGLKRGKLFGGERKRSGRCGGSRSLGRSRAASSGFSRAAAAEGAQATRRGASDLPLVLTRLLPSRCRSSPLQSFLCPWRGERGRTTRTLALAARSGTGGPVHQVYGIVNCIPARGTFGVPPPVDRSQHTGLLAPLLVNMDSVSGYEDGRYLPPPPDMVPVRGNEPYPPQTNWNIPAISEDEAKEAFIQYASSKCCYSPIPAKEMCFRDLQTLNTYRYRLETFTESRSLVWKTEPYNGGVVDSFLHGTAPLPWDVRVQVPAMFKDKTKRIKVPHTSSVKGCPTCGCSGRSSCHNCNGLTKQQCTVCSGRGHKFHDERCTNCMGTGTTMCSHCSGKGITACSDCEGKGQLLVYIELQVEWKNNIFEHLVDQKIGFPTELFKEVNGKKLFHDEQLMVYPMLGFPDSAISQASKNAVEQHRAQFGSRSRILRQRQTTELILLSKVEYEWHGKSHSYYVYGNEHKVYAEDYPKKCFCTII